MNPIIPPNRICGQRVAKKTGEPCRRVVDQPTMAWTSHPCPASGLIGTDVDISTQYSSQCARSHLRISSSA